MSEMFRTFEQDFLETAAAFTRSLNTVTQKPASFPQHKKELEKSLDELRSALESLDEEFKTLPTHAQAQLKVRLQDYKNRVKAFEEDLKKAASVGNRSALVDLENGGGGASGSAASAEHRDRLQAVTAGHDRNSALINQMAGLVSRTNEDAENVKKELRNQRDRIINATQLTEDTTDEVGRSRRLLSQITKRMVKQKMLLVGVIIGLAVVIVVLIIIKVSFHRRR